MSFEDQAAEMLARLTDDQLAELVRMIAEERRCRVLRQREGAASPAASVQERLKAWRGARDTE